MFAINKISFLIMPISYFFMASFTYAYSFEDLSLKSISDIIITIVGGTLIPILIAGTFVVFVINLVYYLYQANSGSNMNKASVTNRILYPILAMFILFSVWGFIYLLRVLFTG